MGLKWGLKEVGAGLRRGVGMGVGGDVHPEVQVVP